MSELRERVAEARNAHKVTRFPDTFQCVVCGDIGWAVERHDIQIMLDAVRAAVQADPMLLTELGCQEIGGVNPETEVAVYDCHDSAAVPQEPVWRLREEEQ